MGGWAEYGYRHAVTHGIDASDQTPISFLIQPQMSVPEVAEKLARNDIIAHAWYFTRYTTAMDFTVQAGLFTVRRSESVEEIAETFRSAPPAVVKVTIPEGYTLHQIDGKIAKLGLAPEGTLELCAKNCALPKSELWPEGNIEGYLFPDTYFIDQQKFSPEEFLTRMLKNFEKRLTPQMKITISNSERSIREIVIIASLLEREAANDEEKAEIAGVMYNRLKRGMRLDVDATVRYAIDKPTGRLTKTDLDSDSRYNTRKFLGLPPGPIANPGLASLNAAIFPKSTSALYYLHDSNGQVHFSTTLDEHNTAKARYIQ